MYSLQEIEKKVRELALQIEAPSDSMPTFGNSRNDGTPDVDVGRNTYYFIARDRDTVVINRETSALDQLLYWVFRDVTLRISSTYIRKIDGSPTERIKQRWNYQLALLDKLDPEWKERYKEEMGSFYSDES